MREAQETPAQLDTDTAEEQVSLRVMLPLCLAAFVGVTNVMGIAPFFPDLANDLDSTVPVVGQAISVALFTAVGVGLVAGPLADHYGHGRILLVGITAAGLSALGTALAPGLYTFMGSRLLAGAGSSIGIGVSYGAAVSAFSGPARRRAISTISSSLSLGTAVGPLALTSLAALAGWRGAFLVVALLAALALVMMWSFFPSETVEGRAAFSMGQILTSYLPILGDRGALRLYGVWALRSVCWVGSVSYLGAYFSDEYGHSTQEVGIVYLIGGAGYFTGTVLAGGRLGGFNLRRLAALTLTMMGLGWSLVFVISTSPSVSLAILVGTAVISGVAAVSALMLVAERTPAGPATSMVLTETVLSFGAAAGGAAGGLLLGLGGYIALGLGIPMTGVLAGLLIAGQRGRRIADESEWRSSFQ